MKFKNFTNKKLARIIVSLLALMVMFNTFAVPIFAKESSDNLSGWIYEFGKKEKYTITGNENRIKTSRDVGTGTYLLLRSYYKMAC